MGWQKVLLVSLSVVIGIFVLTVIIFIIEPRIPGSALNGAVRVFTKRKPFYSQKEIYEIYPEAKLMEEKVAKIKEEFLSVQNSGANIPNVENIDRGQGIIAKNGSWKALILRTFGSDSERNMKLCPTLASIIKNSSRTVSCFYSVVEPRRRIPHHSGYYGGVLRYHLGIVIPKDRKNCWIRVDDTAYCWREGRGVMFVLSMSLLTCKRFDDLYDHEVFNNTDERRVVLFVDVIRPLPLWLQPINRSMLKYVAKSRRIQNAIKKSEIQQTIKE